MSSYSPVQLRFIETNGSPATDHIVNIKRNPNGYQWYLYDGVGLPGKMQVYCANSREDIFDHLKALFNLLTWDQRPYKYVQIILPAFPSPLISLQDIPEAFYAITDMLRVTFDHWPENMSVHEAAVKAGSNPHRIEVDEYAGMPPLIPLSQVRGCKKRSADCLESTDVPARNTRSRTMYKNTVHTYFS